MRKALWMMLAALAGAGCYGERPAGPPQTAAEKAPAAPEAVEVAAAPAAVNAAPAAPMNTAPAAAPVNTAPAAAPVNTAPPAAPAAVNAAPAAAPAVAESQAAPQSALPASAHPRGPNDIAWTDSVAWKGWEDGVAQARADNRPIALLVYADWCPKCKALAPVFADPAVLALTKDLVMIKQDQDDQPAFLQERFGDIGGYVPRLLFLRPDGTLRTDITSGHPRYPYFYNSQQPETLQTSLRTAAKG